MKKRNQRIVVAISLTVVLMFSVVMWTISSNNITPGEELARRHCSTCHEFPEPELLTKQAWSEFVLPQMAFRMGFPNLEIVGRIAPADLGIVLETVPDSPTITPEQFKAIREYYVGHAPNELMLEQIAFDELTQFTSEPLPFKRAFLTLLEADTIREELFIGTQDSWLFRLDRNLMTIDSLQLDSAPSYIASDGNNLLVSLIGILMPNDQKKGRLVGLKDGLTNPEFLLDSLQRPVHFASEDFNNDGINDFLVSNFGHYLGNLSLYTSQPSGFSQTILASTPGARRVVVRDFNGDKRNDIMALFAQGDERLVLFLNEGNGSFKERTVLRFPPVYGSNYFDVIDFNKDGYDDILLTNGDNGDFSIILKPYHGIRIFLNDGSNSFTETRFFPLPGASQVVAHDFDLDGDLDLAAISFFPDFERHPERSFVYLKNDGDNEFTLQYTKAGSSGRWLVMTTWDYDADGDVDIFLGASSYRGLGANETLYRQWSKNATSVLLLKNEKVPDA